MDACERSPRPSQHAGEILPLRGPGATRGRQFIVCTHHIVARAAREPDTSDVVLQRDVLEADGAGALLHGWRMFNRKLGGRAQAA